MPPSKEECEKVLAYNTDLRTKFIEELGRISDVVEGDWPSVVVNGRDLRVYHNGLSHYPERGLEAYVAGIPGGPKSYTYKVSSNLAARAQVVVMKVHAIQSYEDSRKMMGSQSEKFAAMIKEQTGFDVRVGVGTKGQIVDVTFKKDILKHFGVRFDSVPEVPSFWEHLDED